MQASHQTNIIGSGAAHCVQESLHSRGGKRSSCQSAAIQPNVITIRINGRRGVFSRIIRFIIKVKKNRRIASVNPSHRTPKGDGVGVRHRLLFGRGGGSPSGSAGGRSRRGFPRPMKVKEDINVVVGAPGYDTVHDAAVVRTIRVCVATTEPIVLVHWQPDEV